MITPCMVPERCHIGITDYRKLKHNMGKTFHRTIFHKNWSIRIYNITVQIPPVVATEV
jgi:hypothetical protein